MSPQSTRHESQIYHMRILNNWVKSQLIERAFELTASSSGKKSKANLSVLDFCCGKGGDLFKWVKSSKGGETPRTLPPHNCFTTHLFHDFPFS